MNKLVLDNKRPIIIVDGSPVRLRSVEFDVKLPPIENEPFSRLIFNSFARNTYSIETTSGQKLSGSYGDVIVENRPSGRLVVKLKTIDRVINEYVP